MVGCCWLIGEKRVGRVVGFGWFKPRKFCQKLWIKILSFYFFKFVALWETRQKASPDRGGTEGKERSLGGPPKEATGSARAGCGPRPFKCGGEIAKDETNFGRKHEG